MHFSMYDFLHARHNFVSHTHSRMVEEREELGGSATMMDNTAQTTDANTQLTKRRLVVPYVKQDHGILRGRLRAKVECAPKRVLAVTAYTCFLCPARY